MGQTWDTAVNKTGKDPALVRLIFSKRINKLATAYTKISPSDEAMQRMKIGL